MIYGKIIAFLGWLPKKMSLHTVTVKTSNNLLVITNTSREKIILYVPQMYFRKLIAVKGLVIVPICTVLINRVTKLAAAILEEYHAKMQYKHDCLGVIETCVFFVDNSISIYSHSENSMNTHNMSYFKYGLWYKFSSFMGVTDYKTVGFCVMWRYHYTDQKPKRRSLTIYDFFWKDLEATCWSKCKKLIYIK